ncbi:hypothetical protein [Streptomyces fructofermentans]|uniref:hypothetical protein n=1 Tax=Streptomyces fructofermentans TaxID=152141 RepID=UPI0033C05850
MAPRLRPLQVAGLLLVLLAGPAHTSYAAPARPSAAGHSALVRPEPTESRAGSRPGQGRERPGREAPPTDEDTAPTHPDGPDGSGEVPATAVAEPPVDLDPRPPEKAAGPEGNGSEPVFRVLPLGSGLVLIGLGLGLAFLGLRARRP